MAFSFLGAKFSVAPSGAIRRHTCSRRALSAVSRPAVTRVTTTRMCDAAEVGVGDVVLISLPYGKFSVAVVTNTGGQFADVVELEEYSGVYVKRDGKSSYESLKKMRSLNAEFDEAKDGYAISPADIDSAKAALAELGGSTGVKAAPDEPAKDYSQPLQLPKPTKTQAFIGAAVGVASSVAFYIAFSSARSTYSESAAGEASSDLFRNIVLTGFWWGALLSLIAGGGLLLYGLTSAED